MLSIYLYLPFIVSHDHFFCSVFIVNTMSVRYLLSNRRTSLCKKFCIVFLSVLVSWSNIMPHHSLKSHAVTSAWRSDLWKVLRSVTSEFLISRSLLLTSTGTYFVTFIDTILLYIFSNQKHNIPHHTFLMSGMQPYNLYTAPPLLSPQMIESILENKLLLDPKDEMR